MSACYRYRITFTIGPGDLTITVRQPGARLGLRGSPSRRVAELKTSDSALRACICGIDEFMAKHLHAVARQASGASAQLMTHCCFHVP
jgi:hypothetical protein